MIAVLPVNHLVVDGRVLFTESVLDRAHRILSLTHPILFQFLGLLVWQRIISQLNVALLFWWWEIACLLHVSLLMDQLSLRCLLLLSCKIVVSSMVPLNVCSHCNLRDLAILIWQIRLIISA
jgi:hypothetical protein